MNLKGKKIGFAITGSFCAFDKTINEIKKIIDLGAKVIPIMSTSSYTIDTKYGKAKDFVKEIENITNKRVIHTISEVESMVKKEELDIIVIAPATSNVIAKLANNINDNVSTFAVELHLINEKPVVIGISAYNGLSSSAENIAKLLNRKNYYFVPFRQSNPVTKPYSLSFDTSYIIKTIEYALNNEQLQPILL